MGETDKSRSSEINTSPDKASKNGARIKSSNHQNRPEEKRVDIGSDSKDQVSDDLRSSKHNNKFSEKQDNPENSSYVQLNSHQTENYLVTETGPQNQ